MTHDDPRPSDPATRVTNLFRHSGQPFLNSLHCKFGSGILVLSGWLPTFHLNEIAVSLASQVEGVEQVESQVEVAQRPPLRRMG